MNKKRLYLCAVDAWVYIDCEMRGDTLVYPLEAMQFADIAFTVKDDGGFDIRKNKYATWGQIPRLENVKELEGTVQDLRRARLQEKAY